MTRTHQHSPIQEFDSDRLFCTRMGSVVHLGYLPHGELGVALRGGEALVAKQLLNGAQIGSLFQHVGSESMAKGMRMHI